VDRIQRYLTLLEWQPGEAPATVVTPAPRGAENRAAAPAVVPVTIQAAPATPPPQSVPPAK
jgi:hypothetical protein